MNHERLVTLDFCDMKFPAKYWIPGCAIATLILTELTLRLAFGLGKPALIQADADMGYRFQPNQTVFRFGKKLQYNHYSQRSEPINAKKPQGTLRILMTGDSILNGGSPTDQRQIISELFEARLVASGKPAEVLNASAGSWGIGNQQGYLRKFGTFESDAVILEINTPDLTQPTSTSERVGRDPNYPDQAPLLAIQEAWTRYAWPRFAAIFGINSAPAEIPLPSALEQKQQFKQNMQHLEAIATLVRAKQIPLFVLFVPQRNNLVPTPNTPEYKSEFLKLCREIQLPVIDAHAGWSTLPPATVATYYRDNLHPDVPGNQAVANLLFEKLCSAGELPACAIERSNR